MQRNNVFLANFSWCLPALGLTLGLKHFYSLAGAEELTWILAPVAALVEVLTGTGFYFETHTGYVSHDLHIIIAPACAGVNFLIAMFCVAYFSSIFKFSGWQRQLSWYLGCAAGSYLITLFVNTLRILVSILLITNSIHAGWLTPGRVHRVAGILIYFFFLIFFYHIIQKILSRTTEEKKHALTRPPGPSPGKNCLSAYLSWSILPLACYWAITIAVPWFNGACGKNPAGFAEHCLTVITISATMTGLLCLSRRHRGTHLAADHKILKTDNFPDEAKNPDYRR